MPKEKSGGTLLIEVGNEANNWLLASFSTKSSEISTIFTRQPDRVKVSIYTSLQGILFSLMNFMVKIFSANLKVSKK